jgi:hypothetical protein
MTYRRELGLGPERHKIVPSLEYPTRNMHKYYGTHQVKQPTSILPTAPRAIPSCKLHSQHYPSATLPAFRGCYTWSHHIIEPPAPPRMPGYHTLLASKASLTSSQARKRMRHPDDKSPRAHNEGPEGTKLSYCWTPTEKLSAILRALKGVLAPRVAVLLGLSM